MLGTTRLIQKSYSITGLPLTCSRQIQIAADQAKGAAARLAGVEVPKHDYTERTFADLKARLAKTVAFVQSFKPSDIDGSEDRETSLKLGQHTMSFKGQPVSSHGRERKA
jgi:hypothetical protein